MIIISIITIFSNVKWLEAGGVQVVPIIVNGSIDQTDYFREVDIISIILVKILILQMFTSLNGLMIPGGPDTSVLPDAGVAVLCPAAYVGFQLVRLSSHIQPIISKTSVLYPEMR